MFQKSEEFHLLHVRNFRFDSTTSPVKVGEMLIVFLFSVFFIISPNVAFMKSSVSSPAVLRQCASMTNT